MLENLAGLSRCLDNGFQESDDLLLDRIFSDFTPQGHIKLLGRLTALNVVEIQGIFVRVLV